MKKLLLAILLFAAGITPAQQVKSAHQMAYEEDLELAKSYVPQLRKEAPISPLNAASSSTLSHTVFGFLRYSDYVGSYKNYIRYDLLTHIAPFNFSVSSSTGAITAPTGWPWSDVINAAHNSGVKVIMCVVNFSATEINAIITGTTVKTAFFANVVTALNTYNMDGVCIDFEGLNVADRGTNIETFLSELTDYVHTNVPGSEVSFAGPAINWSGWNFTGLAASVDYIFIMGYDFYGSGSSTTGPSAPLIGGSYNITTTLTSSTLGYDAVVKNSPEKLILGVPYYGNRWQAQSASAGAAVISHVASPRFYTAETEAASYGKQWADNYKTPWYYYDNAGTYEQVWYDDSVSLGLKYDMVKSKNLLGTGMWALCYDADRQELWKTLERKFSTADESSDTVIADFEISAGVFDKAPTYSGSTVGISTASTSARSTTEAHSSAASLQLVLKDNSSVSTNWSVRLLSGSGSAANNKTLNVDGTIKLYLKTSSAPSGAQIAITVDDGAGGTELSPKLTIVSDGAWRLYQWNMKSSGWTSFASGDGVLTGPNVTLDAVMLYGADASSDWTLYIDDVKYAKNDPLPVELTSFTAAATEGGVRLNWETATELNAYKFTLYRRLQNESAWSFAGEVNASGNSYSPKSYTFMDKISVAGVYVYKLTSTDFDGYVENKGEVTAAVNSPAEFKLTQNYPNPFNPATVIKYSLPHDTHISLKVYDMLGREAAVLVDGFQQAGNHEAVFNAGNFASGIYIYVLSAGDFKEARKMIVTK